MTAVVIAAAGASRRMGGALPKQYMKLGDLPVLVKTVKVFRDAKVPFVCVAVPPGDEEYCEALLKAAGTSADLIIAGGSERQDTVERALRALPKDTDKVLIQDGARPFASPELIDRVLKALGTSDAVVPAVRPKNTIRTAEKTLDRSALYEVQTPQGFDFALILEAYEKASAEGFKGTDDASLVERLGRGITIVEGEYSNIKITTKEDLPLDQRTGMGYDVHRLVAGRKLMLGCVEIPYEKGLLGHSDADVICHALADALLGACALGDIGKHFPDSDPEYEGMSGERILRETAAIVRAAGFTIINTDVTLVAERPKVAPYIEEMRRRMAEALGLEKARVSVKATTEEGPGISGDGNPMAAYADAPGI